MKHRQILKQNEKQAPRKRGRTTSATGNFLFDLFLNDGIWTVMIFFPPCSASRRITIFFHDLIEKSGFPLRSYLLRVDIAIIWLDLLNLDFLVDAFNSDSILRKSRVSKALHLPMFILPLGPSGVAGDMEALATSHHILRDVISGNKPNIFMKS